MANDLSQQVKDHLRDALTNMIVNRDEEASAASISAALQLKFQERLGGVSSVSDPVVDVNGDGGAAD